MLLALYVGRCSPCWKEVEVIRWLEKNVQLVLNAINAKDVRVDDYQEKLVANKILQKHFMSVINCFVN